MRLNTSLKDGSGRSKSLSAERLVNLYPEAAPSNAKSPVVLHGTQGLNLFATVGTGPIRGEHRFNGIVYVVSGAVLYRVSTEGVGTPLGAILGTGPVTMADNGVQLCIVSNPKGYIYTTSLVAITDPDFPGATSVAFLDGYFIFTRPDSGQFFISALYDGTDIDALDFATAESSPDKTLKVFVDHREIWLFGELSTEIWWNAGTSPFPFARIDGAIAEKGIGAIHSVAKVDNSVFWLDHQAIVRRAAEGYVPVRISTHEIEHSIASGDWTDSESFTFSFEGHEMYALTVPGSGTFVYDAATQVWHERRSHELTRWRASGYVYAYGKHLVGDYVNGNIYELSLDDYDENGQPLVAEMIFPPIQNDGQRFTVNSLQLDLEAGVGGATESQVAMQTSKNGLTWSNELWSGFGKQGERENRALWRRLGQYRNCHIRLRISDPVKKAIYTAYADING